MSHHVPTSAQQHHHRGPVELHLEAVHAFPRPPAPAALESHHLLRRVVRGDAVRAHELQHTTPGVAAGRGIGRMAASHARRVARSPDAGDEGLVSLPPRTRGAGLRRGMEAKHDEARELGRAGGGNAKL